MSMMIEYVWICVIVLMLYFYLVIPTTKKRDFTSPPTMSIVADPPRLGGRDFCPFVEKFAGADEAVEQFRGELLDETRRSLGKMSLEHGSIGMSVTKKDIPVHVIDIAYDMFAMSFTPKWTIPELFKSVKTWSMSEVLSPICMMTVKELKPIHGTNPRNGYSFIMFYYDLLVFCHIRKQHIFGISKLQALFSQGIGGVKHVLCSMLCLRWRTWIWPAYVSDIAKLITNHKIEQAKHEQSNQKHQTR